MRRNMVQAEAQNQDVPGSGYFKFPSGSKLADQILCSCGEKLLEKKLFSTVFIEKVLNVITGHRLYEACLATAEECL